MTTHRTKHGLRRQRGVTLIELMVAMVLGLLLLAGVIQVFLSNRQSFKVQEGVANVQESGRFAEEFLARDLRMAGLAGCTDNVKVLNHVNTAKLPSNVDPTYTSFGSADAIRGVSYPPAPAPFPAGLSAVGLLANQVVRGTDAIIMQQAIPCPGADVTCHNNDATPGATKTCKDGQIAQSAELKISDNSFCKIGKYDIVLVSDCVTAEVFSVTNNPNGSIHDTITHGADRNVDVSTGNPSPKLNGAYGEGSSVYRASTRVFYIGFGASGEPALFRCEMATSDAVCGVAPYSEELVEGVYGMKVLYGEDLDNDSVPNRYVSDINVTDWARVVTARITIELRSPQDNIMNTAKTYAYDGSNVTDRRLRHEFTFTIALRNRI